MGVSETDWGAVDEDDGALVDEVAPARTVVGDGSVVAALMAVTSTAVAVEAASSPERKSAKATRLLAVRTAMIAASTATKRRRPRRGRRGFGAPRSGGSMTTAMTGVLEPAESRLPFIRYMQRASRGEYRP